MALRASPNTLNERHGATLRGAQTRQPPGPPPHAKQSAYESVQHIAGEAPIVGQAVAQRERQRQDPLPYRHDWKDAIDQMRRRVRHAPSGTRRTPDAPFTGKRQQPIPSAVLAVKAQKTPRENAAIQKGTEFFFDESGDRTVALLLSCEERFQFFGDNLVEHSPFRLAGPVCDADSHEGIGSCKPARQSRRRVLSNMCGQRVKRPVVDTIRLS